MDEQQPPAAGRRRCGCWQPISLRLLLRHEPFFLYRCNVSFRVYDRCYSSQCLWVSESSGGPVCGQATGGRSEPSGTTDRLLHPKPTAESQEQAESRGLHARLWHGGHMEVAGGLLGVVPALIGACVTLLPGAD